MSAPPRRPCPEEPAFLHLLRGLSPCPYLGPPTEEELYLAAWELEKIKLGAASEEVTHDLLRDTDLAEWLRVLWLLTHGNLALQKITVRSLPASVAGAPRGI